jgi:hypothetical protein
VVKIAIISFTNYSKGQTRTSMAAVMEYTKREAKTLWQGQSLVSGFNCRPESVYDDFLSSKLLYHKDDKVLFFHMVQSHPKGADVNPITAHAAAMELAKYFEGREVLVCTHTDRGHVHSHFIINSVSLDDGRKLHISEPQLVELRQRNDQVCEMFDLPVFQKSQKKKVKSMSTAEYHTASKGESWKFRLINTIDECMQYAGNREEFITLMRTEGYDVRWEATRKNITYTTPSGMKCRDERLHDERYLKGAMEREFGIRQTIIAGRTQTEVQNSDTTRADAQRISSDAGETGQSILQSGHHLEWSCGLTGANRNAANENQQHTVTDEQPADTGGTGPNRQESITDTADLVTGWEQEREILFSPSLASTSPQSSPPAHSGDPDSVLGNVAQLGHALERNQDAALVMDATTMTPYTDKKTLSKERKKKIVQGSAPDDHEDKQQTHNMSM